MPCFSFLRSYKKTVTLYLFTMLYIRAPYITFLHQISECFSFTFVVTTLSISFSFLLLLGLFCALHVGQREEIVSAVGLLGAKGGKNRAFISIPRIWWPDVFSGRRRREGGDGVFCLVKKLVSTACVLIVSATQPTCLLIFPDPSHLGRPPIFSPIGGPIPCFLGKWELAPSSSSLSYSSPSQHHITKTNVTAQLAPLFTKQSNMVYSIGTNYYTALLQVEPVVRKYVRYFPSRLAKLQKP